MIQRVDDQLLGQLAVDPRSRQRYVLGRVPVGIALVGVLVIGHFAWFPFDVVDEGRSFADVLGRFSLTTGPLWHPREAPANVLLFVPLGFGIGGVARGRGSSRHMAVSSSVAAGILFSTLIEVVQSTWLLRDPAVDDLVANTIGAALGGWLWTRFEPAVAGAVGRVRRSSHRRSRRMLWLALSLVPTVLVVGSAVASRNSTQLASWDTTYPLVLGNEATGDRPWSGEIAAVSLTARALSRAQTSALLDGRPLRDVVAGSALLDYDFSAGRQLPAGLRPGGSGTQRTDTVVGDDGLRLGPGRWVVSNEPPTALSASIAASGAFTVFLDVATSSLEQDGPARILTISTDPLSRNLSVAQDGADLVVRVRSTFAGGNGTSPEFAMPGVFDEGSRHVFVIVYDSSTISVTVDEPGHTNTIELFPPTVPMVEWFTDEIGRLRSSSLGGVGRHIYFAAAAFVPWAACNALLAGRRWACWRSLARVTLLIPIVELVLWRALPEHSVDREGILWAAVVPIAAYAAIARAASRRLHLAGIRGRAPSGGAGAGCRR